MSNPTKHIILGAGGAIGKVLAEELLLNNELVKLVSRSGHMMKGAESVSVDLLNINALKQVVDEASIVYLTAGLKYDTRIWSEQWPEIIRNTVVTCEEKNAKLIFFDNVYAYGKVKGKMTEETKFNPGSKKGKIRAELNKYILDEIKNKNINAIIARAADFYGPYTENSSIPFILIINNLAKDKKAQWIVNAKAIHSFTYTPDCGKALYLLAKNEDTFNQIWHLPTAHPPITGEEFIQLVSEAMERTAKYMVLKSWMLKAVGIFNKQISELYEMLYQYKFDYYFDSSKFEKRFGFTPTTYKNGIAETVKSVKYPTTK